LALVLASGCRTSDVPDLLTVYRIDPHRASAGDRVVITGDGFPEARPARVTFHGDLYRPGAAPEHDVRIALNAEPLTRNAVVIPFDAALERRFAKHGTDAPHVTFRGDLRVSFEPAARGRTEVAGVAHDVAFDVLGTEDAPLETDRELEGTRSLAFLGITGSIDAEARGLRILALDPEGKAALGGLRAGDLVQRFDGVTVLSLGDVRARPGEKLADVAVERDGRPLPTLQIPVDGLSPFGAEELEGAATLLVLAVLAVVLPTTPAGTLGKWFLRLAEARSSGKIGLSRGPLPRIFEAVVPGGEARTLLVASIAVLVGIVGAFTWLATGRSILSPEADLVALLLVGTVPLVAARFVAGGASLHRRFSMRRALVASARTLSLLVPMAIAVFGAVLASGRFVVAELVADQGGVPWRWAAARNPGLALLAFLLVASAVPETGDPSAFRSAEGMPRAPGSPPLRRQILRLVERSSLWVVAGLAVTLFAGGFRVPGLTAMVQEQSRPWAALGVAVFLTKVAVLVVVVGGVRRVTARVWVEHVAPLWVRWMLPLSVLSLAVAAAWATLLDGLSSNAPGAIAAYTTLGLGVLAVSGFIGVLAQRRPGSSSVNPWL